MSPLELESDEGEVNVDSSVVEQVPSKTVDLSPRCEKDDSDSSSGTSSSSSSSDTRHSTTPSAAASAGDGSDDEHADSNGYLVTSEDPKFAAERIGAPMNAAFVGGQIIDFLSLQNGGHECQFLSERFGNLDLDAMVEAYDDLALRSFVASRCVSRKLHQRETETSSSSELAALQARVSELENQLASEKERNV